MVTVGRGICVGLALICVMLHARMGLCDEVAPSAVSRDDDAIHESVLKRAIDRECGKSLCLLSVGGNGIDDALYQKLKKYGHVAPARPDDFVFENGAYRGFSVRSGRILDVTLVSRISDTEASARVNVLTGALNSRACRFRLLKRGERWVVDDAATECTIS